MAAPMNFHTFLRNAALEAIEEILGTNPRLCLFTFPKPVGILAADPLGLAADQALPSDWMSVATDGVKAMQGVWTGSFIAPGTVQSFRLKQSGGVAIIQGSVSAVGGGGNMTVSNVNALVGRVWLVTQFDFIGPNP